MAAAISADCSRASVIILILVGIVLSTLVEFIAVFITVYQPVGWADTAVTFVWIASVVVAIVPLVLFACKKESESAAAGGSDEGSSGNRRFASRAMMITGAIHSAAFCSYIVYINAISKNNGKHAHPLAYVMFSLPGAIWILAGYLAVQSERNDADRSNLDTEEAHNPLQTTDGISTQLLK